VARPVEKSGLVATATPSVRMVTMLAPGNYTHVIKNMYSWVALGSAPGLIRIWVTPSGATIPFQNIATSMGRPMERQRGHTKRRRFRAYLPIPFDVPTPVESR
jgi:hypothetical protein